MQGRAASGADPTRRPSAAPAKPAPPLELARRPTISVGDKAPSFVPRPRPTLVVLLEGPLGKKSVLSYARGLKVC